ncbi:MAG TPA: phospho-N-acetylmuramoyl-pentapeptide-transferase [Desulfitobacteriaceae bacterium]|nr:phospho-N-acetylmuramoyl-pentapeptide-transferase [Desulfitobacteriaceae bacterium]
MWEHLALAAVAALLFTLIFGPLLLPLLRLLKFGQNIREEGPQSHQKKAGTPTMGGVIFLAGITAGSLLAAEWPFSAELLTLMGTFLGFALIGFWDDYIKVVKRRNLGLRAYQKLLGQFLLAAILCLLAVKVLGRGTDIAIPFTGFKWEAGWLYFPLVSILIVFINNAVNLTDGLDGLAAGGTLISALAYIVIASLPVWLGGRMVFAQESDLALFAAALVGGCLGFLRFNIHPAKVFMGDTGSLGLGGALAGLAVLSKSEAVLLIIGGLFVLEALSVIIQVISFQTTGKRVFRMSPLHHHFELGGWSEWKVVLVFWLVSLLFAVLGIIAFIPTLS